VSARGNAKGTESSIHPCVAFSLDNSLANSGGDLERRVWQEVHSGITSGCKSYFWLNTADLIIATGMVNNQVPCLCQPGYTFLRILV
jgi:hypothetical protein